MRKKYGNLIIIFSILVTLALWLFVKPTRNISLLSQYSELLASIALVGFALINFISTRSKILDKIFHGIDKSYIYHRYLSISVLVILLIHDLTISIGKRIGKMGGIKVHYDKVGALMGSLSLYLFVILIITAIVAKKLNYERWKNIHKLMIVAYAFGIYHYYFTSDYAVFSFTGFAAWMNIINLIGIMSAFYSIFLYEKVAFKYDFTVKNLNFVADGTLEITGATVGRSMDFKPGQFAFIKTKDNKNKFPSHPFTISEAPKDGEIQFTIKGLGDHTKDLFKTLKTGDKFSAEGPHGKFDYREGGKNQIWIAGGIGVTPFRSFMQSDVPEDYSIDFFYAFNDDKEGAYTDELEKLAVGNGVKLHLVNSKKQGFLTVDKIGRFIKTKEPLDVYFCGPKPMRDALISQFENSDFVIKEFHYEHFQFK
ncbi:MULTISPECIES: ferredoxin reductase family protein [Clostridium]|uniref:ferredoxin reductase family protein n=1 Tax=Clostridium TaxID=1485 RepID=UPI000826014F|nr:MULTISPECIES: ferric reductase-like transmembrane domain-containing protein [Clostridium]PJI08642.1 hypothetical protein CUB90_12555 [Clostridium sp. CT7]